MGASGGGSVRFRGVLCGVYVPIRMLMRETNKEPESNAAVGKSEYRELWLEPLT